MNIATISALAQHGEVLFGIVMLRKRDANVTGLRRDINQPPVRKVPHYAVWNQTVARNHKPTSYHLMVRELLDERFTVLMTVIRSCARPRFLRGRLRAVAAYDAARERQNGDFTTLENIHQHPLSVSLRGDWEIPGSLFAATGYQLQLCRRGPTVRLIGDLDGEEPKTVRLEYQDWFTPWQELAAIRRNRSGCKRFTSTDMTKPTKRQLHDPQRAAMYASRRTFDSVSRSSKRCLTTSPMLTMPTSLPSAITGKCRTRLCVIRLMARFTVSSGATVIVAWVATSGTAKERARSPCRETARTMSRSDMRPVIASPLFTTNAADRRHT
jgi:hypothetical protein